MTLPHRLLSCLPGLLLLVPAAHATPLCAQAPIFPSELVSSTPSGAPGAGNSGATMLSADGSRVAFVSDAPDLLPEVPEGRHVYVRELPRGPLVCLSTTLPPADLKEVQLAPDGHLAVITNREMWTSYATIRACDVASGALRTLSVGFDGSLANGASRDAAIAPSGRHVSFWSHATNLVPDDTNGRPDVFLWDRGTGQLERVSFEDFDIEETLSCRSSRIGAVSADGRFVLYDRFEPNPSGNWAEQRLALRVRDRVLGRTRTIPIGPTASVPATSYAGTLLPNGRELVAQLSVASGTQGFLRTQLFLIDVASGSETLLSRTASGAPGNNSTTLQHVSPCGRFVLCSSTATNLDAQGGGRAGNYLYDLEDRTARRLVNDCLDTATISGTLTAGARYLGVTSSSTSIVAGHANGYNQAYRRDLSQEYTLADVRVVCAGDGSAGPCYPPCSSYGPTGAGCDNLVTGALRLSVTGVPSVTSDTLRLVVAPVYTGWPGTPAGIFVRGSQLANGGLGVRFGVGLLCVGGAVVRLGSYGEDPSSAPIVHGYPSSLPLSVVAGGTVAGSTAYYQYLFRTPGMPAMGCGNAQGNGSNALSVTWFP